jgi:hypothetical protein
MFTYVPAYFLVSFVLQMLDGLKMTMKKPDPVPRREILNESFFSFYNLGL